MPRTTARPPAVTGTTAVQRSPRMTAPRGTAAAAAPVQRKQSRCRAPRTTPTIPRTAGTANPAPLGAGRAPRKPEQPGTRGRSRSAAAKDEDPGLVLISRRPPQQKFSNFEEYMTAHGGATAPIEDHSEEI